MAALTPTAVPLYGYGRAPRVMSVRFRPDTANDPTYIYKDDAIASVAHTSTGVFTITFRDAHYLVVGIATALGLATSATDGALNCQIDNEGTSSALAVVVNYTVGGTLTDLASNADNWISVIVIAEDCRAP